MGFKDKVSQYYIDSYMKKFGDRLTQVQGKVLSVKSETKSILGIYHKIRVALVVKPDYSKSVINCVYEKKKWFKKASFIDVNQGHTVLIQGLKLDPKKKQKNPELKDYIEVMNVRNFTTKIDLAPMEGGPTTPQTSKPKFRNR